MSHYQGYFTIRQQDLLDQQAFVLYDGLCGLPSDRVLTFQGKDGFHEIKLLKKGCRIFREGEARTTVNCSVDHELSAILEYSGTVVEFKSKTLDYCGELNDGWVEYMLLQDKDVVGHYRLSWKVQAN